MPSGPVTTWRPEKTVEAEEYIISFLDKQVDESEKYARQIVPSIAGLSVKIKVNRTTLYSWADDPATGFADILEKVKILQEQFLLNNGLNGVYNSTIAKLMLGKHGYKDQSEHTGADGKDLIPEAKSDIEAVRRIAFAFAKAESLLEKDDATE